MIKDLNFEISVFRFSACASILSFVYPIEIEARNRPTHSVKSIAVNNIRKKIANKGVKQIKPPKPKPRGLNLTDID